MLHRFDLDGKRCWLCPVGDEGAAGMLLFLAGDEETPGMLPDIVKVVEPHISSGQCRPFVLAGFESADWEGDLTPWPAPALFKRAAPFAGNARQTLAWVESTLVPACQKQCVPPAFGATLGIMGYSLGGLFALWSLCESTLFRHCGACSPSLWYDEWPAYMASRQPPQGSRIYLSLGKNEERAKNQRMARVGDVTRQAAELYAHSPCIAETTLQWHEGGHFDDVPGRLAQTLLWLTKAET